jgi:hypothetical protein
MNFRLLLALLLLAAAPALAEDSIGSGRWSAVTTCIGNGAGGECIDTPTATETINIVSGHTVQVDSTGLQMTTGGVVVASGGVLEVGAGSALHPGAGHLTVQAGGTLRARGNVLGECWLRTEPDWSGADPVVTLNCPAATLATTSDYIVYADEDPPGAYDQRALSSRGAWTRRAVWARGGPTPPGAYRISANRWAWYPITALGACPAEATCGQVTYDGDQSNFTFAGGGFAPFIGSRGHTATVISAANLSFTIQPGRRATLVAVAAAHGSVVVRHADRGSGYLYFMQNVANAADPTYCSERLFKILHTEDGGGGDDLLYVAGDASMCTNGTARIIPGALRGDKVYLVRPAVIDGDVAGVHSGSVRVESGATLDLKWALFNRLGYTGATTITPNLARHCNFCMYQSAGSPAATINGRIEDVAIRFPEFNDVADTDTGVLSFISMGNLVPPNTDYRYPDVGLMDFSGLRVKRVFVADSRNASNAGSGAGGHGAYIDGAKNLLIDGGRIERISDDLFGANVNGNSTGSATDSNFWVVRRMLAYEGLAQGNTSQQCFEPTMINDDTPAGHAYVRGQGAINVEDSIAVGCYFEAIASSAIGGTWRRVVNGGNFDATANGSGFRFSIVTGTGLDLDTARPNRIHDSLLTTYSEDGTSAVTHQFLFAELYDSVVWGDEQSADAGNNHQGYQGMARSLVYFAGSTGFAWDGISENDTVFRTVRSFTDFAFQNSTGNRWAQSLNTTAPFEINLTRFLYMQTLGFDATNGSLGSWTTATGVVPRLRSVTHRTGAAAGTKDLDVASGGVVSGNCYESNNAASTDFQTYASATNRSVTDLGPDVANSPALGLLVDDRSGGCPAPLALGVSEVGLAHVLLGSGIEDFYPIWTSHRGILRVPEPSHPRGGR